MRSEALSRHPLAGLFQARSVALIGASDRSPFSVLGARNFDRPGFQRPLYMVNLRGVLAHGRDAVTSCRAIPDKVDAAYVCVPQTSVLDAVRDAAEAGIKNFVVVSSGFAEVGDAGVARQDDLVALCRAHHLTMLGPNCLGFVNHVDGVAIGSLPAVSAQTEGSVALVSNSGATVNQLRLCAEQQGIGITHLFATGNESMVDTAAIVDYLVDDPAVRAIALFIETIRNPDAFARTALRACAMRKPIVVLKLGAAENTAAVAAAHTGALVGDDRVFDAVCRRLSIIRVHSLEQLVCTAAAAAVIGPLKKPGVAVVSQSGGACGLISDQAEAAGLHLTKFSDATTTQLKGVLSELGHAYNPLDLTGAVVPNPALYDSTLRIVSHDADCGLAVCHYDLPEDVEVSPIIASTVKFIAEGLKACDPPGIMMTSFLGSKATEKQKFLSDLGIPLVINGIDNGVKALAAIAEWSDMLRQPPINQAGGNSIAPPATRLCSERDTLAFLAQAGVPVIQTRQVRTPTEAAAVAREFACPVALKIASPDIAHKTEVGGVKLGLIGDKAVAAGFDEIMANAASRAPQAHIEGAAISPMRNNGLELIVSVTIDAQWGPILVLGLGGIWVEVMKDSRLLLLPTDVTEVVAALQSLRAAPLLQGYRGRPAIDLARLAEIVVGISRAAVALGPDLAALEINPLFVSDQHIEALDALTVWRN